MKKILSLCLAVIMLLGIVAMGVSAEETEPAPIEKTVKLSVVLTDGIAMRFTFTGLDAGEIYDVKFTCGGETTTEPYEADGNGNVVATYPLGNPGKYKEPVTAAIETESLTRTNSLLQYCDWALNNMAFSNDVHSVVVDLLNYCSATELYLSDGQDPADPNMVLGRELTEAEKAILSAVTDEDADCSLTTIFSFYEQIGYIAPGNVGAGDVVGMFNMLNGDAKKRSTLKGRDEIAADSLYLYDMLVENSWGGEWFASGYSNPLTADSFKIGDIFYFYGNSAKTWILLYIGNGQFVAYNSSAKANTGIFSMNTVLNEVLKGKDFTYTCDGADKTYTMGSQFRHYFILRPSQVFPSFTVQSSAELSEMQAALGTADIFADMTVLPEANQEGFDVQFGNVTVLLGTSIGYRADILSYPEGTTFWGKLAGREDVVQLTPVTVGDRTYVDFTALNPANAGEIVTFYALDADNVQISADINYSVASYTSETFAQEGYAKLKNLVAATMAYSQGVLNYINVGKTNAGHLLAEEDLRPIADSKLTAAELYRFSKATGTGLSYGGGTNLDSDFVKAFYASVGIEIGEDVFDITHANAYNECGSGANTYNKLGDYFDDMFVAGKSGSDIAKFPVDDFQIGDVWSLRLYNAAGSNKNYRVAIFIGGETGKTFLVSNGTSNATTMQYEELLVWFEGTSDDVGEDGFRFYNAIVFRPEKLYNRDLAEGALTADEKAALQRTEGLKTLTDITSTYGFLSTIFGLADVDVSPYFTMGGNSMFWNLFASKKPNPAKVGQPLYEMMDKEVYGGTYFTNPGKALSVADFDVGDILFGRYSDGSNRYCTLIYLGEGKFMYHREGLESVSVVTLADVDDETTEDVNENINAYRPWYWYYVLRPGQLAN